MSEKPNNPADVAERKARAHGYTGAWPPPPRPAIRTAQDLERVLDNLSAGELASNNVAAVEHHLMSFFGALDPEAFRRLGEQLRAVVLNSEAFWQAKTQSLLGAPAARVKIRAVQGLIKPLVRILKLAPEIEKQRGEPGPLLAHLYRCVVAFLGPMGDDTMAKLADALVKLALEGKSVENNVRAIATATDLVLMTMETAIGRKIAPREVAADDPEHAERQKAALAEAKRLEKLVDECLRRRRTEGACAAS